MTLSITPLYAIALASLFLVLSARVIIERRTKKFAYRIQDDNDAEAKIRAQANWAEYVPITLLLMLLAELNGAGALWLHLTGIILLVGRLLHGYAMSFNRAFFRGRVYGTALTLLALPFAILLNIALYL